MMKAEEGEDSEEGMQSCLNPSFFPTGGQYGHVTMCILPHIHCHDRGGHILAAEKGSGEGMQSCLGPSFFPQGF